MVKHYDFLIETHLFMLQLHKPETNMPQINKSLRQLTFRWWNPGIAMDFPPTLQKQAK